MKSKFVFLLILSGMFLFSHSAFAYVDSLGRVWPGKKPSAKHKVVKKSKAKTNAVKKNINNKKPPK